MSTRDFLLPDLGEGLTEGEVVSWLVAVGDVVEVDQYVAEIETAKAVVEVPSPFGGTVATLHAEPGEEVLVGSPLITIDVGGDDSAATGSDRSADLAEEHGQPAGVPAGDLSSVDAPGTSVGLGPNDAAKDQPAPEEADGEAADREDADDESGSVLVGYGTSGGGRSRRRRTTAAGSESDSTPASQPDSASSPTPNSQGGSTADMTAATPDSATGSTTDGTAASPVVQREGRPLAKPPVRKMAKDLGVDLDHVAGSGDGGVITRADVQAAADAATEREATAAVAARAASDPSAMVAGSGSTQAPAADAPSTGGSDDTPASTGAPTTRADGSADPAAQATETRIPLGQMRKAIAAQMGRSRREIPEAVTWVEADATPLWKLRKKMNDAHEVKISPLALIMRMTVAALREYPSLNSTLDTDNDEIVQYGHVNLGIAAQTPRGLVVPVIAGAHTMNTIQLAEALNDRAATARAGKLTPSEMSGGTFTISNYGAFGVDGGDMVINHPEVAILGVGRILDKPWVVGGKVKVRKVITYSIAFDHRVCDGGEGAGFLRLLADMTQDPTSLMANL